MESLEKENISHISCDMMGLMKAQINKWKKLCIYDFKAQFTSFHTEHKDPQQDLLWKTLFLFKIMYVVQAQHETCEDLTLH